ncbi:MAG: coenzyme F420-0:L-glutamate ligase [Gammaproteobacteria bacterium]
MPEPALSLFPIPGVPEVEPGMDIATVLFECIDAAGLEPRDGDVVAVAQKIVSKAEGRFVNLDEVTPSAEARALAYARGNDARLATVILNESRRVVRDTPAVIIVEHRSGIVLATAGIDRSNVTGDENTVLLLPADADASAAALKQRFDERFGAALGVLITDSVGRPWRQGTTGIAIGCSGIAVLNDLRGQRDMFGRVLQVAEVATADCIAGAASLIMGEGADAIPAILVRGAVAGASSQSAREILRPPAEDLFR